MRAVKYIFISVFILAVFHACSVKKYIPEDEFLYRGGTMKLNDTTDSENNSDVKPKLEDVLYPEPNSKVLGIYPGLYFHYKGEQENPGFLNKFLNDKIGEDPAYFSAVNLKDTEELLQNRLENNGFFYSSIHHEVEIDSARKTAEIDYTIDLDKPYRLENYVVEKDSSGNQKLYNHIESSLSTAELKQGKRFNLNKFKKERERIDDSLKSRGYYYFNKDFLLFEADTNQYDDRRFDLYLKMKDGVPEKSKVPYVIDSVKVLANMYNDTIYGRPDTVRVKDVDIIQSSTFFKPERLRPYLLLEPGQKYNPENSKYTSRRISSIGTYKFVDIQYEEIDAETDEDGNRHLKSEIHLSPLPKRAVQLKLEGVTKSNDFTGPNLGATYINRNIFKGGEDLNFDFDFGYEKQFSKGSFGGSSSLQLGVNASLLFPRLLFPGTYETAFRYAIPKTKISAGVEHLDRSSLYTLNSFSTSFGYIWEQNTFVTHELKPINIDYVNLTHTSERFEEILEENPFLRRSFEQQFIAGLNYSFTYNELMDESKKGRFYVQTNFDIAGNTLDLLGRKNSDGVKTFLGLQYAQYAKLDVDLSYHYKLSSSGQSLVGHIFAGYGLPYGNSTSLPFVKQYFAGGPYSIRAFRIRALGPGTYEPESRKDSYFDQAGDIRLEANAEYRFPIFSYLKGAVFADAGNVWLHNENEALPGGKFSSNFIKELGFGTGVGLRVDVQGFVFRFDLSSAIKRPAKNWKFEYDRPMFNFGIGYPF